MILPKQLTTITSFTKILAGILFITLPFVGFYLGMEYEQYLNTIAHSIILEISTFALCSVIPWYLLLAFAVIIISLVSAVATLIWAFVYFFLKRKSLNSKKYWLKFIKVIAIEIVIAGIALVVINISKNQYSGCNDFLPPSNTKINEPFQKPTATPIPLSSSPDQQDTPTPEGRWKTYTNKQFGFSFEYPLFMYVEEGNDSIVKLSTSKQFEKDEFALVIEVNTAIFDRGPNSDSNEQIVEKDLRLSEIKKATATGREVSGTFVGNPPWSYYSVYFHKSGPEFVEFKIRVHSQIDTDLMYKANTADTYKKLVTEILSTLTFSSVENVGIPDQLCIQNGGKWDVQYGECSDISESTCENIGGKFFDCASACRHHPKYPDVPCMQVCDMYCQL